MTEENRCPVKKAATQRRIRDRKRDYINAIKLARGCECPACSWEGPFHPTMLHFDHINPDEKLFSISNAIGAGRQLDKIEQEITKCIVLCANCHAKKTWLSGDHL